MRTEIVYKDRDNTIDFILSAEGVVADLSGVSKMRLVFESLTTIDSATDQGVFDWSEGNGKLILTLGNVDALVIGETYYPTLVIFDAQNTSGIDWGRIDFEVK